MFMHPEAIIAAAQLRPSDVVADFGAGSGFMSRAAAKLVPQGTVYAIELQRGLVERLEHDAKEANLSNLHPIWGDIESPKGSSLADASVDVVILSNILFQLDDKSGAVAEVARVLKPASKVLVIDWTESFGGLGPAPQHVFRPEQARALFEQRGLQVVTDQLPAGEHHYAILLRKG
ncbi:MAG TPA: class I SAM-dependent methyltransferase [Candidatus Paceibacterota bacterium]|nr:class I SAM-dependent methyltransferase [Candidatus Paceibacterota bacterium]